MQFKNIVLFAATAAALPTEPQLKTPGRHDKFNLIAIHSGSPIQNVGITAANGSLLIGGTNEATCHKPSDGFAQFVLTDESEAFLYSTDNPPQQLYVDRSGMGQGVTGYTTGAQPAPQNSERKSFSISDKGYLVFDGKSPKACPATGAAYSIWFTDLEKPASQDGCIDVDLRAFRPAKLNSCLYSA